jgi:aconitate decarboxylase
MTLVEQLLDHAEAVRFDALPPAAVQAATVFITDSIGVGLAGSRHARLAQVMAAATAWGQAVDANGSARDWASGRRWPAPTAALLNAYQIHNQEFDCVHELAVVHPLATILPALVAQAERQLATGRPVSGAALIEALVLAVDAATTIGSAQAAPMRFFRPAMCGALGATLGLCKLSGATRAQTVDALGIAYSQLAGTMQAHGEGSPMLALQVGLASRAAVMSLDLALAGFSGPHDVLEGPFGYFNLFDAPLAPRLAEVQAEFATLGRTWRITQLSHKPFPTGRAAHGALDGLGTLMAMHGFTAAHVQRVELAAPPLILRLVGRPAREGMDVNYARLCLGYLAATFMLRGTVGLDDFTHAALADPQRHALGVRVVAVPNECTDPNALAPQSLRVDLACGQQHHIHLPAVLGHPDRALSPTAQRAKFDACCAHAGLAPGAAAALAQACADLPDAADVRPWINLMQCSASPAHQPAAT